MIYIIATTQKVSLTNLIPNAEIGDVVDTSIISIETTTVNFASGVTEANVTLVVGDDDMVEPTRTVFVQMTSADRGSIGSPNLTVLSIMDDDCK